MNAHIHAFTNAQRPPPSLQLPNVHTYGTKLPPYRLFFSSFHNKSPRQIKHKKQSYICEENVCPTFVLCVCERVCTLQKTIILYLPHLPPQYF